MILRDLVGGGGRAKELSLVSFATEERRRALTVSAGCIGKFVIGEAVTGWCDLVSVGDNCTEEPAGDIREMSWIAGGGSSKES